MDVSGGVCSLGVYMYGCVGKCLLVRWMRGLMCR